MDANPVKNIPDKEVFDTTAANIRQKLTTVVCIIVGVTIVIIAGLISLAVGSSFNGGLRTDETKKIPVLNTYGTPIPTVKPTFTSAPFITKNLITKIDQTLFNYKVSNTYRYQITGEITQGQEAVDAGEATVPAVSTDGDIQSLNIKSGGFELSISSASEWEGAFAYTATVVIPNSRIANLGRFYVGEKGKGFWRYYDDQSKPSCKVGTVSQNLADVTGPCGSGFILKNNTGIYEAICYAEDASSCDAIMKTIDFKEISE